jgi:hypothetical protein
VYWKVKMALAASAGVHRGTTTCQKIRNSPAPSTRAASSSSSGIDVMYCRSRKMPNAPTMPGRISPQYESSIPEPPTPIASLSPKNGTRLRMM